MEDAMFTYRGVEFGTNLPQSDVDVLIEAMECHERGEPLPYMPEELQDCSLPRKMKHSGMV